MVSDTAYVASRPIGDAIVTVINEGTDLWAPEFPVPEAEWRQVMPEADAEGRIPTDTQVVLVQIHGATILIDAGLDDPASPWGQKWLAMSPGSRRTPGMQEGLTTVGVGPEDITHVVITHAHYDHFVGLAVERNGMLVPRFPNARVLLGRADWENNSEGEDPESDLALRLGLMHRLGLLDLVDGEREVVRGVTMIAAPGESPGHSVVRVSSSGEDFYALGDLFHHACEVEHLDWMVQWADKSAMQASRERLLSETVDADATLMFAHETFPPWGRIVKTNGGYRWQRR